jgi:hypothetical protein
VQRSAFVLVLDVDGGDPLHVEEEPWKLLEIFNIKVSEV